MRIVFVGNVSLDYERKDVDFMTLAQTKFYTEEDYYNLPEDVRAELIKG